MRPVVHYSISKKTPLPPSKIGLPHTHGITKRVFNNDTMTKGNDGGLLFKRLFVLLIRIPFFFFFIIIIYNITMAEAAANNSNNPVLDLSSICNTIQNDIIGTDAGKRGMKSLIVQKDLEYAANIIANLQPSSTVLILSGFPCCVDEHPPTETDGPPGTFAIARSVAAMGHKAIIVTDTSNEVVFAAALQNLALPPDDGPCDGSVSLEVFPPNFTTDDEKRFQDLSKSCQLLIACERAGPAKDGICYTMRGIDMNAKGLIAPLHRLVDECKVPFIGIGDGGNELGMGKVIDKIIENIPKGDHIGCVVPANYLIAASVSNWGGYALAAAAAVAKSCCDESSRDGSSRRRNQELWLDRCLPTEQQEIDLLKRCVDVGCRDGVSGKVECTVDGMSLETSLQCLKDIRKAAAAVGLDGTAGN